MNRQDAGAIYDQFTPDKQNMPKEQFIKEMRLLTDPKSMQRDLAEIQRRKEIEHTHREAIDRGLNHNG